MAGIISYGVHVPRWRISAKCINQAWSIQGGKGETSVANFDEDSLTMGVSSALACLKKVDYDEKNIGGLFFATTTPPYQEKSSAATIATALDLDSDIRMADYGTSLKASTNALLGAVDSINSKAANSILVTGSDCRLAEPGSSLETNFGDASASILLGNNNLIAEITETYSAFDDIFDLWRRDDDVYVRQDDVRFAQKYGYEKSVTKAIKGIMDKTGLSTGDFDKLILTPVDRRTHIKTASKIGFDVKDQLQDTRIDKIGVCGNPDPFLLLSGALEEAKPGDKILLVSYGDGSDAIFLKVTEGINKVKNKGGVAREIATTRELSNYNKYISFKNLIKGQGPLTKPFSSTTMAYREKDSNVRLYARECMQCKKVVFLRDIHVCPQCNAQDEYKLIKLTKEAVLFTYNQEYYYPSPDLPTTIAIVDFPEGARITTQMTDVNPENVTINMPVEMCFRKFHDGNFFHNYFWKCRPILD